MTTPPGTFDETTPSGTMPATSDDSETIALLRELVRRPSITPDDAGCQALIAGRLERAGFHVERLRFGEVENLWARRGKRGPLVAFAGHTDVVPTGDESRWSAPPFEARRVDGHVVGRGTADMKAGVAAMITACERFVAKRSSPASAALDTGSDGTGAPDDAGGSIGVLLTSDEEGPAIDGTARVIDALEARGEHIDFCVLGEPSSAARLGDTLRVGRRGSLGARLVVRGVQGHVAYPALADNPVHRALPMLAELVAMPWDDGDERFPPTTLQVSNVRAGTGATNVVPGELIVDFNLRYSPASPEARTRERIEALAARHGLDASFTWLDSARPFLTGDGRLVETMSDAIRDITGIVPVRDTGGGTSDGRFIAPRGTELVELGPLNATIHAIDERVSIADVDTLSAIYERALHALLPADGASTPGA